MIEKLQWSWFKKYNTHTHHFEDDSLLAINNILEGDPVHILDCIYHLCCLFPTFTPFEPIPRNPGYHQRAYVKQNWTFSPLIENISRVLITMHKEKKA